MTWISIFISHPTIYVTMQYIWCQYSDDLERLQKTFVKLILKKEYVNYEKALLKLNLDTLASRREKISLKFANDGIINNTLTDLLIKRRENNSNIREVKKQETYNVNFANTDRLKQSTIIYLQNLLNQEKLKKK